MLVEGRVLLDGQVIKDAAQQINAFSRIRVDGLQLQGVQARYYMLHKPRGLVSATVDKQHQTVLDLFAPHERQGLHIAGRLDLNTTGLMLITNDGRWSRRLTEPEKKIPKVYQVETEKPVLSEYKAVFSRGIYFAYENLTTRPAALEILSEYQSRLTIYEGRYHQVKRMFAYFNNKVTALHREQVGQLRLDNKLAEGEYRPLTIAEIKLF